MIEVKHLKTLQALRNCGSLAAAAATLHQTQSALSHQFSDLEQKNDWFTWPERVPDLPVEFYTTV